MIFFEKLVLEAVNSGRIFWDSKLGEKSSTYGKNHILTIKQSMTLLIMSNSIEFSLQTPFVCKYNWKKMHKK